MIDERIEQARLLLVAPEVRHSPWLTLGAAGLAAAGALLMAGVFVLGPGVRFEDPAYMQGSGYLLPNG
ncbi:hypothetical protein [Brevundimonas sp. Root1279]|uniref:hypothetical protein n=1 Tax=Brevundimonas sp. Root1279 TaxID=1736443 RepID=UPI0006FDFAFF|nr:hypothetical protein [Brevundimonas sp. Root1279]KQW84150.1 hypothetical protein ASC65_03240 [Brevundimonas sp. Root1279]